MSGSHIERTDLLVWTEPSKFSSIVIFCDQRSSGGYLKLLSKFREDSTRQSCSKQTDRVLADRSTVIPYRLNQEVAEKYINLLMIIIFYRTITNLRQFVQSLEGYKEIQKSGIHGSLPSLKCLRCGHSI